MTAPLLARQTEPVFLARNRTNLLTVQTVTDDRSTPGSLVASANEVRVYLRGELIHEALMLSPTVFVGDTVQTTMLLADVAEKAFGPILIHWRVLPVNPDDNGHADILQDGWLVRYFPSPTLTDQDLLDVNPDLLDMAGPSVVIVTGANAGQPGFETFHRRAWSKVIRRLFRLGRRVELVLSPSQLWDIEFHTTMELISRYFWQTMGDQKWRDDAADHRAMKEEAWGAALVQYDFNENGLPDETWTYPTQPNIRMGRERNYTRGLPLTATAGHSG